MLLIIFNYQTFSVASLSLNKLYFQKETCFVTFADLEICHTFILLPYHQTMVYVFCSMTTFKAQWLLALDCTLNSFQVGAQSEAAASKTLPSGLWRAQASLISALRAKCACDKMLVFFNPCCISDVKFEASRFWPWVLVWFLSFIYLLFKSFCNNCMEKKL